MGYHIRIAEPRDRGEILGLVRELFGPDGARDIDIERRHTWLYDDNPHGQAITWLAIDDETGAVAGCSSFFPRRMALPGRTVRGALGGDCFVHPRLRRRGVGTALHRAARGGIGLATARDAATYAWRFVASPSRRQRAFVVVEGRSPIATCALERVERRLRIIELVAPADKWGAALAAICNHDRECDVVEVLLTRDQAAAHRIWRHGFIERGGTVPLNIVLPEGDPQADLFWTPQSWYVTWLESDMDTTR